MYQVATAYALAVDNGDRCAFNFRVLPAMQGNSPCYYRPTIYKKLEQLPAGWRPKVVYKEKGYNYFPIKYSPDMLLEGYFGVRQYFEHRRNELIELFKERTIINDIYEENKGILSNSVSLHVRRGDYLALSEVYVILSEDYYLRAIELLDSKVKIDNIIVFSDDIKWCRDNFRDDRMRFIQYRPDYYDLYLMSMCNHNIIANSSFSWWATYLNENKGKITIAPRKWFRNGKEEISALPNPKKYYEYCRVPPVRPVPAIRGRIPSRVTPDRNPQYIINESKIPREEYIYCNNWILI